MEPQSPIVKALLCGFRVRDGVRCLVGSDWKRRKRDNLQEEDQKVLLLLMATGIILQLDLPLILVERLIF